MQYYNLVSNEIAYKAVCKKIIMWLIYNSSKFPWFKQKAFEKKYIQILQDTVHIEYCCQNSVLNKTQVDKHSFGLHKTKPSHPVKVHTIYKLESLLFCVSIMQSYYRLCLQVHTHTHTTVSMEFFSCFSIIMIQNTQDHYF